MLTSVCDFVNVNFLFLSEHTQSTWRVLRQECYLKVNKITLVEAKPLCGPSSDEKWTSSIYNHLLRANGTTPVAGKCIAGESDRPWVLATVNKKIKKAAGARVPRRGLFGYAI